VTCVLLDSVQSQANRMELALQDAMEAKRLHMPLLVVDFSDFDPTGDLDADEQHGRLVDKVGKLTSLQLPHRLADAILRDSELDKVPFRLSDKGRTLDEASFANATPLFELCPTALVFGMWDSTGPKGSLGPKFERAMVSEIVGIGAALDTDHMNRGVRRDPLEIRANIGVIKNPDKSWKVAEAGSKKNDKPSAINHGSVPFARPNAGVTIEYAEQVTTLSLIGLRRYRFPLKGQDGLMNDVDQAARVALAALGLCAATLAFEKGMDLRSRCLLWPEGVMMWELLEKPGQEPRSFVLDGETTIDLHKAAVKAARAHGLPCPEQALVLKPNAELVKLVRLSQLEWTKEDKEGK